MTKYYVLVGLFLASFQAVVSQGITGDNVEFNVPQPPKVAIPEAQQFYAVTVTSPYNITADDVIAQSKIDFQNELDNYDQKVLDSEAEHKVILAQHEKDIEIAKEKYAIESKEYSKLSLLERMAVAEQGKKPTLVLPSRPTYYKPAKPIYRNPNLNDYVIVDNTILASKIVVNGMQRGENILDIQVAMERVNFQDNAGKSYANLPTNIAVSLNGVPDFTTNLFTDFELIANYPTNNINKNREEKAYLEKVIKQVNQLLNERYGYINKRKSLYLEVVKNRKNTYDDLEKAHIYVLTNLKKIQEDPHSRLTLSAMENLQKGLDIWDNTLAKIDYKNSKADYNAKIAQYVYFNLIKVHVALNRKEQAENYLNALQENLIYIKLSYDDEQALKRLEKEIYTQ
ncbi:hypothetical protein ACFSQP_10110 [Bizionia sediminis]|uniref:TolC family protein n=1 Tax=Bizionia sediminis TaxID=1737064 RepID=A0ABW5KU60_9FLAO